MQLIPVDQISQMAQAIAQSGLFGIKTPAQALALGLICQAEGRHPAEAARDYHIIQGRPTLKADAMLARFQQSGGKVEWTKYTDEAVEGTFTHPQGGSITIGWDIERAKKANLAQKEVWKQYPRQMLRARVLSEAIRSIYPQVLSGMYTPEEVQDLQPVPQLTNSNQNQLTIEDESPF